MTEVQDIVAKIDQKMMDTMPLRERMDSDLCLWDNENFREKDGEGLDFEQYTSNDPMTYGHKAVSIISGTSVVLQTMQNNDNRSIRDDDNAAEQFALGGFRQNDENLTLNGGLELKATMAFHLAIRGWTSGRHALVKDGGRSWTDATPFDPRDVSFEYGGTGGLLWLCNKTYVSRAAIKDEYNKQTPDTDETELVAKYDYYDRTRNLVIVPQVQDSPVRTRRHRMRRHGRPRVPCWNVPASLRPLAMTPPHGDSSAHASEFGRSLAHYGESIYAENRKVWPAYQLMMSIMMELASRSRKPVFGIQSRDGMKLVEGNPFQSGSEIPLAEGETLVIYDMLKSAPDLINFMTIITGEMQRGGFPVIMFGETPATISGFAMNTLKGGVTDKVLPAIKAMTIALKQITNAWRDHLNTRAFGVLELSGLGQNRKWFSNTFTADTLEDLPELEIELTPQLPEDDVAKMAWAQQARTAGWNGKPILSDYTIREKGLQIQNSDMESDAIDQEQAEQDPTVQAMRMTNALEKRGDEGAKYWNWRFELASAQAAVQFLQAQAQLAQLRAQMAQLGINPDDLPPIDTTIPTYGGGFENAPETAGFDPSILPNAGQGIRPPQIGVDAPGQAGPFVEPGRERPGAQNGSFNG